MNPHGEQTINDFVCVLQECDKCQRYEISFSSDWKFSYFSYTLTSDPNLISDVKRIGRFVTFVRLFRSCPSVHTAVRVNYVACVDNDND